jgi:hypothetical protein
MQQQPLQSPLPLPCPPPPPPPSQAQAPIFLQPHSPRPRAGSRRTRLSLRYTCCARKAPVTGCWRGTGAGRQRQKREGHTRTLIGQHAARQRPVGFARRLFRHLLPLIRSSSDLNTVCALILSFIRFLCYCLHRSFYRGENFSH